MALPIPNAFVGDPPLYPGMYTPAIAHLNVMPPVPAAFSYNSPILSPNPAYYPHMGAMQVSPVVVPSNYPMIQNTSLCTEVCNSCMTGCCTGLVLCLCCCCIEDDLYR